MNDQPDGPQPDSQVPEGWAPGALTSEPRPDHRKRTYLALGALALVVVVGAVFLFIQQGGEPTTSSSAPTSARTSFETGDEQPAPGSVRSADDTGPITIITDDETCGRWDNVQTAITVARNGGWDERDPWVPASNWTQEQRGQFEAVGDALRTGADTAVSLAAQTPHRAMRELYEAFVAYGRAYSDGLADYQPMSEYLAQTSIAAADAITQICAANKSKVASVQEPGLAPAPPPTAPPTAGDPANPQRFLAQSSPACERWSQDEAALLEALQDWSALDPNIGVGQLDKQQILTYDDAAQTVTARADAMQAAGRGSGNPVVEDLATLGAMYFRAYAKAVPLIWAGDHDMAEVGLSINRLISASCQAVTG